MRITFNKAPFILQSKSRRETGTNSRYLKTAIRRVEEGLSLNQNEIEALKGSYHKINWNRQGGGSVEINGITYTFSGRSSAENNRRATGSQSDLVLALDKFKKNNEITILKKAEIDALIKNGYDPEWIGEEEGTIEIEGKKCGFYISADSQ
jgi:hypothetical protein